MTRNTGWKLHEILAVVTLLDAQGWRNPAETDAAWLHLATMLDCPITAVICRAREICAAHPEYSGAQTNYSADDKRVVDAYLFAQHAIRSALPGR